MTACGHEQNESERPEKSHARTLDQSVKGINANYFIRVNWSGIAIFSEFHYDQEHDLPP